MTNVVNHPDHYKADDLEAWDVLDKYFPNDPLLWNAGKYLLRLGKKDKPAVEVGKLKAYLDRWLVQKGEELLTDLDKQLLAPQEFEFDDALLKIYWNREELANSPFEKGAWFIDSEGSGASKSSHVMYPEAGPYVRCIYNDAREFRKAWRDFLDKHDL